jgi:CDP-diacylglycerol--glycerol-3-phosphate 3-phosphatidyltransferase
VNNNDPTQISAARPRSHRLPTLLTATILTFLKPRLKRLLYPIAATLARVGITANQVTLASLAGSIAVGTLLCVFPAEPSLFAMLPVWSVARTACASLDGTLAVEFGEKSRLGAVLNEVGDVVSEIALFLPLAFIPSVSRIEVSILIALVVLSELAGLIGLKFGGRRHVEGPLGKADRSVVLSALSIAVAILGRSPDTMSIMLQMACLGAVITAWNRLLLAAEDQSLVIACAFPRPLHEADHHIGPEPLSRQTSNAAVGRHSRGIRL